MSSPTPDAPAPVLVAADDDEDVLRLIAFRFERSGFRVLVARDGAEALALVRESVPDIAVLDVRMPKMDGYEVTRAIRADEKTKDVPIVLLTARVQDADVERGFEAGADDYVRKPFSPQELRSRVQAILGRR